MRNLLVKLRPKTSTEWLIVVAIIAVLVAILLPPVKWASSGSIVIPVDVTVFDAISGTPIEGAGVAIVRAPPATKDSELLYYQEPLASGLTTIDTIGAKTNSAGLVTIDQEFRTGANYERPTPQAHTRWYWLLVSANGYGSTAVPIRYESMPSKELNTRGHLPAFVGLVAPARSD